MRKATPTNQSSPLAQSNFNTFNGIILSKINDEYRVSSRLIASGAEVQHQAVVKLLKKHELELQKHGSWSGFKIQSSGQKTESFLNEDQAYLLMTFLRNTETVVLFKSNLVKAYSKLRKQHQLLVDRFAKLEYQQNRAAGKLYRRDLTDEIKPFIEYANDQGSKGSQFLYSNITKWINKACGIESVADADEIELANISTACDIVMNAIQKGMNSNKSYKEIKIAIKENLNKFSSLIRVNA